VRGEVDKRAVWRCPNIGKLEDPSEAIGLSLRLGRCSRRSPRFKVHSFFTVTVAFYNLSSRPQWRDLVFHARYSNHENALNETSAKSKP